MPDIIGSIGVTAILLAYFLNLYNIIQPEDYLYLFLNIFGAAFACVSSIMIGSIPFTVLEAIWTLISIAALIKKLRS